MTWSSQGVSSFDGLIKSTKGTMEALQKELTALKNQKARLEGQVSGGADFATTAASSAQDALSSGIYNLVLEPEQGSWKSRILSAAGAPPRNATDYCAVIASVVATADVNLATDALNALSEAASKVIPEPKKLIVVPTPAPISLDPASIFDESFPAPPAIPEPEVLPANEWKSVRLADVFPSVKAELEAKMISVMGAARQAQDSLPDLQAKIDEVQAEFDDLQDFLNRLEGSGVFAFKALPEQGDWYDRLTAAQYLKNDNGDYIDESGQVVDEANKVSALPDDDPSMYCAGTVTVIIGSSLTDLQQKYQEYAVKS